MRRVYLLVCVNGLALLLGVRGSRCCAQKHIRYDVLPGNNRFTSGQKGSSITDGQHRMKRLRSRKERSQMRGGGREASKSKAHHHHHCHRQSSKDMACFLSCCHSSGHCPPRREAPFPHVVPAAQEPSIITDSRLIGHHGLFNHEVKSIDIERLLSEQRKLKTSGQQKQEKRNANTHPSSTSHIPSPRSTTDLLGAVTDEVLPFEKKAARGDCRKKEKQISQGSDITPGQRTKQQLDLSSGSFKSISSSKHSSLDGVMTKSKKADPAMPESPLTPTPAVGEKVKTLNRKVKRNVVSTLEHTPENRESPVHQTQAHSLSPSPLRLSSSHNADSLDVQDPDSVSKSVSAVAAGLCGCLQFPLLKRRNLVAESREVLLKALWERHGPRLQENLLQVQRCHNSNADPAEKPKDQQPTRMDDLLPPGRSDFNWKSRSQPHHNLEQTAEWSTSPVETSVNFLDDVLRPNPAPQFCLDLEPPGGTTSDRWFSPTSCWGEKASLSPHWEDGFNRPKGNNTATFDPFGNSFMNTSRALPERSSGPRYSGSNSQPLFPYQTQLPERRSAEPMHFPQEKSPFETDRYFDAPSFFGQNHRRQRSFQPSSQFSHPSTCPPVTSHHTDMIHYPPSHMLDRDPAAPPSSFLSPETWSFPPMRLY